jgi:prepilin-type N-terminal cleavage/methylation domain-containing protein
MEYAMRTVRIRRGFTLIETVVTVGIVAAMAAVVIPQVAKQFDAADPTRFQNDMKNIQTAIETFSVNVKQLPGDLDDLMNQPGTGNEDSTITNATTQPIFTSTAGLWNGPYLDVAIRDSLDTDATVVTGFQGTILDSFVCFDSANNERGVSEGSSLTPTAQFQTCPNAQAGQRFLAVQVTNIACSTTAGSIFMQINELFDGTGEGANPDALGRIRCRAAGGARATDVPVVYFLAVGIS